ncbi:MAG: hypothetical protein JWO97_3227 [Acidobacteria bacterium]|nr:hypothetical protein [Acidobacteriota bacterium]
MKRTALLIALALVAAACQKEKPLSELASAPPPASSTAASKPPAADAAPITIFTASGERAFELTLAANKMTIRYALDGKVRTIEGEQKTTGKRKYIENGTMIAEVKPGDTGGFKVRSADGKTLLWKVKREADKVKVSDNEENAHPFELKTKSDRIEIRDGSGKTIGAVRYDAAKHLAIVEDATSQPRFNSPSERPDRFLGVAILDTIPLPLRAIIMAELSARDR